MKKLLVLFFVAAMCVPCYGANDTNHINILVYGTTTTATIFDFTAPGTRTVETMKGFLVLDVNLTSRVSGRVLAAQHVTYSGTSQQTEVVDVLFFDGNVPDNYAVLEYSGDNYDAIVYGLDPNTDIGRRDPNGYYGKPAMKKHVATTLGGHNWPVDTGSGIMSATLDLVRTKAANRGDGNTIAQVVAGIETYLGGTRYYSSTYIQDKIDAATDARTGDRHVTVTIPAGTFAESIAIHEPNVTLKSASGKAVTIIAPGASYQQAIEINDVNVIIDGFTIKQGTQAYSGSNPQEHTIWVHANYSTIKNCTIIGAGGNQACIFIGGRQASIPKGSVGTALWGYNVATDTTKGHKILNNAFRYGTATAGSGQGWGIFAVKLTDDCNISGNTFNGDLADLTTWNTNEGAPGTGIIIHSATKGSGTNAVTIQNNTAQYIQNCWLTFSAHYPYNDTAGKMYEQTEDSEVNGVMVRNNTIHDLGSNWTHNGGVAIKFMGAKKSDAYDPNTGDLTIGGANGVIIKNNTLYNNGIGVYIREPTSAIGGKYGCVLQADKITIDPNNSIYGHTTDGSDAGYGVYNGIAVEPDDQDDSPGSIDANNNWWGYASGPYHEDHTEGYGNQVSDGVTFAPHRTTAP